MYRAYWAIPRTLTRKSDGLMINTVFGVASMLIQIINTEKPDGILFCFDEEGKTLRHTEYAEYKAGRAETPQNFYDQIPLVFRLIDAWHIPRISHVDHEADDYLCAYAKVCEERGDRVTIVTGDRDALQLATERIRIAVPSKGYQVPEYFGPREIEAKYGITPKQVPSYKGLVGDSSDNLPGVRGIGPKAAEALLREYGSLDNLYQNIDKVKPAWREKLVADKEQAFFCERMAKLNCDIPMSIPFDQLLITSHALDDAQAFFAEMEFVLLTKRLQTLLQSPYGQEHFTSKGYVAQVKESVSEKADSAQLSLLE